MLYLFLGVLALEVTVSLITGRVEIILLFLIGNTLFLLYLLYFQRKRRSARKSPERNAELSFKIANETMPYLRRGLNEQNA